MVTRQKFPESWIAVVIDSGGTIVARSHQSERFIGQKASSRLVEATRQSLTGTQESRTLDGIPVVTSFTRSERSGWSVAVGIPKEELNQQLWHSLWNALGITALLLVAGFGAAWYIARRVSGSITELGKPALALGQGGEVRVPRLYFKEADELGQALTTASTMLQESTAAARAWQARLRAILESAMDAIVVVDDEGTVVLFNSAAVSLFGWPLEESLGRPLTQFIPERQLVLDPGDPAPICIQYLRTQDDIGASSGSCRSSMKFGSVCGMVIEPHKFRTLRGLRRTTDAGWTAIRRYQPKFWSLALSWDCPRLGMLGSQFGRRSERSCQPDAMRTRPATFGLCWMTSCLAPCRRRRQRGARFACCFCSCRTPGPVIQGRRLEALTP